MRTITYAVHLDEGFVVLPVPGVAAGQDWQIASVRPQPSRSVQTVVLSARAPAHLRVEIYDIAGRLARTLHDGPIAAGHTPIAWDGRDGRGRPVAAGIYFLHATDGTSTATAKTVRLR